MSKSITLSLLFGLCFALSACGGGGGSTPGSTTFDAANYSLPANLSTVPDQSTLNANNR